MNDRGTSPVGLEELSAYVDGELAGGRRSIVERHLANDAEAARRVSLYRRQDDLLRQVTASLAEEGVTPALATALERGAGGSRWRSWRIAAAAVLFLVVAIGGGWLYRADHSREWTMATLASAAVTAHASYPSAPATVPTPLQRTLLARQLQQVVGTSSDLPDLTRLGYTLVDGQPLRGATGPAIVLWYRNGAHDVVTCYFVREGGREASSYSDDGLSVYSVEKLHGINVAYGLEDGFGYAVAGYLPPDRLVEIAKLGNMEVSQ